MGKQQVLSANIGAGESAMFRLDLVNREKDTLFETSSSQSDINEIDEVIVV